MCDSVSAHLTSITKNALCTSAGGIAVRKGSNRSIKTEMPSRSVWLSPLVGRDPVVLGYREFLALLQRSDVAGRVV